MSSRLEDVKFIETDLVPEMVHNRCFCEAGSREFVELESVKAEPMERYYLQVDYPVYRATVVVQFSGEPETFHTLVKLLPEDCLSSNDPKLARAFDAFLNEEIMWNKGAPLYGRDFFPRFFVADMGRYGRPVIVVEDLEKCGYERVVDRLFTREEAMLVVEYVVNFHGKGMYLKKNNHSAYRELYTKLQDILLPYPLSEVQSNLRNVVEASSFLKYIDEKEDFESFKKDLEASTASDQSVICNGMLVRENLWFKRNGDETERELRVLDWQWTKYATGNLDVAMLLFQCDAVVWSSINNPYIMSVRSEYSEMCIFYAFIVSQLQNKQFSRLKNILSTIAGNL